MKSMFIFSYRSSYQLRWHGWEIICLISISDYDYCGLSFWELPACSKYFVFGQGPKSLLNVHRKEPEALFAYFHDSVAMPVNPGLRAGFRPVGAPGQNMWWGPPNTVIFMEAMTLSSEASEPLRMRGPENRALELQRVFFFFFFVRGGGGAAYLNNFNTICWCVKEKKKIV